MIHVQLKQGLRRIPRRKIRLSYLQSKATPVTFGVYRTLQWPHLRFPVLRYPKRRKAIYLLALMPPVIPLNKFCPNVVGLTQALGTSALTALGLLVSAAFEASSATPGTILRQSIVAGTIVFIGQPISISVSIAPPPPAAGFRVKAVTAGVYQGIYYQPGDVFDLLAASDYSDSTQNAESSGNEYAAGWMLQVAASTPLYQAFSQAYLTTFPAIDLARRTVL